MVRRKRIDAVSVSRGYRDVKDTLRGETPERVYRDGVTGWIFGGSFDHFT